MTTQGRPYRRNLTCREKWALDPAQQRELFDGAACSANPEMWFAPHTQGEKAKAIRICMEKCPVRALCYLYSLSQPPTLIRESHAIWAGYPSYEILDRQKNERERERRGNGLSKSRRLASEHVYDD